MRGLAVRTILSVGFVALLILARTSWPSEQVLRVQRTLMGTIWTVEVVDQGKPEKALEAVTAAYEELDRIDRLMSEWKPDSPVSQINAAAGKQAVAVPAELREMVERAARYSRATDRAFDITWRGMGRIWRFDDEFRVPSQAEVETARKRVDFSRIAIDGDRVSLPAGMNIGLGGIAKGYAVDRAMLMLRQRGFDDALVNGGGDVLTRGTRLGEPWRVGIQKPRGERGDLQGSLALSGKALVTSGDYERFRIVDGVRYHHIIDPRTGWPANASQSVTVLTDSAEAGVVLAKGIFILGPAKGLALARDWKAEALIVDAQGVQHRTPSFPKLDP